MQKWFLLLREWILAEKYFLWNYKNGKVPLSKIKIGDGNTFRLRVIKSNWNKSSLYSFNPNKRCNYRNRDNSGLREVIHPEKIVIGNNVLIGANAIITDVDGHPERRPTNPKP